MLWLFEKCQSRRPVNESSVWLATEVFDVRPTSGFDEVSVSVGKPASSGATARVRSGERPPPEVVGTPARIWSRATLLGTDSTKLRPVSCRRPS